MADREDARRLSSLYDIDSDDALAEAEQTGEVAEDGAEDAEDDAFMYDSGSSAAASEQQQVENSPAATLDSAYVKVPFSGTTNSTDAQVVGLKTSLAVKLSLAQAKLFGLAGGIVNGDADTLLAIVLRQKSSSLSPTTKFTKKRLENLSQPKLGGRAAAAAAANSNAATCTFSWKRSRRAEAAARNPACGYDFIHAKTEDTDAAAVEDDFLQRMDAATQHSRRKLSEQRAEEEYSARLDKKSCPQCGALQSYDEHINKKVRCGQCNVPYSSGKQWHRSVWDSRVAAAELQSKRRLLQLEARVAADLAATRVAVSKQQQALKQQVAGKKQFIERMSGDVQQRISSEAKRTAAAQFVDRSVFVPRIETRASRRGASASTSATAATSKTVNSSSSGVVSSSSSSRRPKTAAAAAALPSGLKPIAGIELSKLNALLT